MGNEAEILTNALPRTPQQIQQFMSSKSMFPRIVPFNVDYKYIDQKEEEQEQDHPSIDDIEAAKTLSTIRFETKKKEKIKQQFVDQQCSAIRLLQQAIFEQEQSAKHTKSRNKRKSNPPKQKQKEICRIPKKSQPQITKIMGEKIVVSKFEDNDSSSSNSIISEKIQKETASTSSSTSSSSIKTTTTIKRKKSL